MKSLPGLGGCRRQPGGPDDGPLQTWVLLEGRCLLSPLPEGFWFLRRGRQPLLLLLMVRMIDLRVLPRPPLLLFRLPPRPLLVLDKRPDFGDLVLSAYLHSPTFLPPDPRGIGVDPPR